VTAPNPGKINSVTREIFSLESRVQRMLDLEAALARAQAKVGIVPNEAAAAITNACAVENFDMTALPRDAELAGNLAIPLVKQLTANIAKQNPEAAKFVHWGATSQDVIDSGLVLQLRDALDLIERGLAELARALVAQITQHRDTLMVGRTLLQHALPITFGLKVAGWLDAVTRHRQRVRELRPRILVLQFGGAAGTLAALGSQGNAIAATLAQELNLALPAMPWHGQRDRVAEVATVCGLLVGTLGKIARDVSLCMQTEVGELAEPSAPGRGGSSTMPHKRNPIGCAAALSAAIRVPGLVSTMLSAMPQEHERGLGGWQAEWETLPEIFKLASGALNHMTDVIATFEINADRMATNLNQSNGLIMAEAVTMALAKHLGKHEAHRIVEHACKNAIKESRRLREILAEEPLIQTQISAAELDKLMDPTHYLGATQQFIDRVLAAANE
jgi:3-carboxy-cis,cis-muconate cycloisomerase